MGTRHYSELEIGLLALRPGQRWGEQEAFDRHSSDCAGCRAMYEELSAFYQAVLGQEKVLGSHEEANLSSSLTLRPEYTVQVPLRPHQRLPIRLWNVLLGRPITSAISLIALVALAGLWGALKLSPDLKNPAHVRFNNTSRRLEVFNDRQELLWQLPSSVEGDWRQMEFDMGVSFTQVCDLDGDGVNEVATILPLDQGEVFEGKLRVFDAQGNLQWGRSYAESCSYRGKQYPRTLQPRNLLAALPAAGGGGELLVSLVHRHSPFVLLRLDAGGKTLGEYWHYGHFGNVHVTDLEHDGQQEIILSGINDDLNVAAIAVLDPRRMVGRTEASPTRGFGLAASQAERYYVHLPLTDIEESYKAQPRVHNVFLDSEEGLGFNYASHGLARPGLASIIMDYHFSRSFELIDIKFGDVIYALHASLKEEGRIFSVLDAKYESDLKSGVRYWDGGRWTCVATRITSLAATR